MITVLVLIGLVAAGFGWVQFLGWVVRKAERIDCEPLAEAPCRMCDQPSTPPDHDCAQLAKAMLTPDCPTIVAGSDIDASQWAGIVQQLPELAEINAARLEAFYLIPEQP